MDVILENKTEMVSLGEVQIGQGFMYNDTFYVRVLLGMSVKSPCLGFACFIPEDNIITVFDKKVNDFHEKVKVYKSTKIVAKD